MKYPLKITVEKRSKKYYPDFSIGVQTFELGSGMIKAEAEWFAKMLRKAFCNYREHINSK